MINPGPCPQPRDRNGAVRRDLSGLQRETDHRGRTQGHRAGDRRARRRQQGAARGSDRSGAAHRYGGPHFAGRRPALRRKFRRGPKDHRGDRRPHDRRQHEKHLAEAFDQISEELRSQYTLGYYPTNTAHDGKFRKIKVDMANHDLRCWRGRATTRRRVELGCREVLDKPEVLAMYRKRASAEE